MVDSTLAKAQEAPKVPDEMLSEIGTMVLEHHGEQQRTILRGRNFPEFRKKRSIDAVDDSSEARKRIRSIRRKAFALWDDESSDSDEDSPDKDSEDLEIWCKECRRKYQH